VVGIQKLGCFEEYHVDGIICRLIVSSEVIQPNHFWNPPCPARGVCTPSLRELRGGPSIPAKDPLAEFRGLTRRRSPTLGEANAWKTCAECPSFGSSRSSSCRRHYAHARGGTPSLPGLRWRFRSRGGTGEHVLEDRSSRANISSPMETRPTYRGGGSPTAIRSERNI
jgi:hypothetical protein